MRIWRKQQKGQAMVEFAVLLPVLLFLLLAIMYMGMAFYDYITISETARSVGRYASIGKNYEDYGKLIKIEQLMYKIDFDNYKTTELGDNESGISVMVETDSETSTDTVIVTVQGMRDKENGIVESFLPTALKTTLRTYKE